ncbi:MAG: hypothetical protein GX997_01335 [Bacteroidales bacterium]|nr:hypothetical protein [Bacteroidales bacterium]
MARQTGETPRKRQPRCADAPRERNAAGCSRRCVPARSVGGPSPDAARGEPSRDERCRRCNLFETQRRLGTQGKVQ